jgi:3-hydroxyisobutyrate dehydrogenase
MDKPEIAFFGLGTMGTGMARRLLNAGYEVTVWNRNPHKSRPLLEDGARITATPRDAAPHADVLIAMLADDDASRAVWTGDTGALAAAKPGAVAIDCTTMTIAWARELADAAKRRGVAFLDAPVTGTKPHAANGELTFLVGGDASVLDHVRPVLQVMSKEILHLGPNGAGATLKLINNFVCGVQAATLGEAFALIRRTGLNPDLALPLLLNGNAGSPLVKAFGGRIVNNDPGVYFHLELMAKDLRYAIAEAQAHQCRIPTGEAAHGEFQAAADAGLGKQDVSQIIKFLQQS